MTPKGVSSLRTLNRPQTNLCCTLESQAVAVSTEQQTALHLSCRLSVLVNNSSKVQSITFGAVCC